MRAARCHRHGPPDVVQIDHVPDPVASAGQVVVDVEVASVNYPDVLLVAGGYQALPPLPFVVGGEFAGTISEVGADVAGFIAAAGSSERQRDQAGLLALLAEGRLQPRVTASFPPDQVPEALQTVAGRRALGKTVVSIGERPV